MLLVCILTGCSDKQKGEDQLRVYLLRGPSSIAFAKWMAKPHYLNGKELVVSLLDSPEQMQATLIKEEAAIASLPMISAANLYNKGISYRLAGCPLWGTLYLVGREYSTSLYLFGAGTTPDILTRYYIDSQQLPYSLNYSFGTAAEISRALLAGKADAAVLSEPFVSGVLMRDSTIHLLADLNNPGNQEQGFAQSAILFHPSLQPFRAELDQLLRESCTWAEEEPDSVIHLLEQQEIFPPKMLSREAIHRCKINYRTAAEASSAIFDFLYIIEQYEPKAIGGKLPDSGFISYTP